MSVAGIFSPIVGIMVPLSRRRVRCFGADASATSFATVADVNVVNEMSAAAVVPR